ncbi:pyrroline-5-carboxylate reductase [Candidatus Vecturithrix granuli]|uniref:Pyrroline-5-carboxylate reductase n=1 Tax=Vecturithrix granuli TaxID=1499967 RepID=A0A0S6WAD1_VECG1|nr:pyrroline-5-carboxylate reductase [Candidatus Vecturithrix granuli]
MVLKDKTLAFIGGGHITEILVSNLIRTHTVAPDQLLVSDPNRDRLQVLEDKYVLRIAQDNLDAVIQGDLIFINVIPQVVDVVIQELRQFTFSSEKLLISIAAGIPMKKYAVLGEQLPIVRALPNPPSQIGWGIAALAYNPYVSAEQRSMVAALFESLGEYVVLPEELINVVTALSSPAPVYLFFQALVDAGIRCGIDRNTSTKIVYQTIAGSMEVWKARQIPPSDLLAEASTPGGVSVECLFTLDQYAFQAAIKEAIERGAQKATGFSESF